MSFALLGWLALPVQALPIEDFVPLAGRTIRVYGDLNETIRSPSSFGGIFTIEAPIGKEGSPIQYGGTGGKGFTFVGNPPTPFLLRLTWDGEAAIPVTSGAGLGCINLNAEQATAFLLRNFRVFQDCSAARGYECPFTEVQLKVFDGGDPTGQRYSTGVVRRRSNDTPKDLMIPFSQLVREGPDGPWRPACVGAVSLTFQGVPGAKTTIAFDSVITNGSCGTLMKNGQPACPGMGGATNRMDIVLPVDSAVEAEATPSPAPTLQPTAAPKKASPIPAKKSGPAPKEPEASGEDEDIFADD